MNMNTLQPFHFFTPPKPKEEDYRIWPNNPAKSTDITFGQGSPFEYNHTKFQKALSEWERLYGSEPRKEDFRENILTSKDCEWSFFKDKNGVSCAYNKTAYDTLLEEWQYHQVRYKGWEMERLESDCFRFEKGNASVLFWPEGISIGWSNGGYTNQTDLPSTDLFELILKENGIEC